MNFEELTKSPKFSKISFGVAAALILIIVFGAGVFVGQEKARFSFHWGENYYNNFAPKRPLQMPMDRDLVNGYGSSGQIIKINSNSLVIKDRDGVEKNVLATAQTLIKRGPENLIIADLKVNDEIVVIGSPNSSGQIEAKLIRVLPARF